MQRLRSRGQRFSRRRFLQASAAAAVIPLFAPRNVLGANERVGVAAIGVGGKGAEDTEKAARAGADLRYLCDVDQSRAAETLGKFSNAKTFKDFRRMLDDVGRDVDAVIVSTPDHIHAPAAVRAMRMGKHVYCQKPLTHTVAEARLMRQVAKQQNLATQMGNQGHSNPETRRLVEIVRTGALGKVGEIHVWTDRPIWPQGIDRPKSSDPVPQGLDWDLWLGPAPERPYNKAYLPFNWRGWLDFGTGALGDMACHCMDLAFFALRLPAPRRITARTSGLNGETYPNWSIIDYEFPARDDAPAVKMTWYDGHKQPPAELVKKDKLPTNGIILVGDKDTLYVPNYWGEGSFLSGAKMADFKSVPQSLPRTPGFDFDVNHYAEWLNACKGGPKPLSNFVDYAGPLTEAVLLGNVALRAGRPVEWDAENLKVTNLPEANRLLTKAYRKGWEIDGLPRPG